MQEKGPLGSNFQAKAFRPPPITTYSMVFPRFPWEVPISSYPLLDILNKISSTGIATCCAHKLGGLGKSVGGSREQRKGSGEQKRCFGTVGHSR